MKAHAPRLVLLALATAHCSDPPPAPVDAAVRFDARDAVVDPRDVGESRDVPADRPAFVDVAAPFDTGAPGTDAGAAGDAASADLGADLDAGQCGALAEAYAEAVRDAQRCVGDGGCATLACETLCCTCEVYVDPAATALATLSRLRGMAQALGCVALLPCPGQPCGAPAGAVCSSEGRCVTLRQREDGGLR